MRPAAARSKRSVRSACLLALTVAVACGAPEDGEILVSVHDVGEPESATPTEPATSTEPTPSGPLLVDPFDGRTEGRRIGGTFTEGQFGQGLALSGRDRVVYPSSGNLNKDHGTIMFWVKLHSPLRGSKRQRRFFQYTINLRNYLIIAADINDDDRVSCAIARDERYPSRIARQQSKNTWQPDQWHHVAVSYTPSSLALYLDGKLEQRIASELPAGRLPPRFTFGWGFGLSADAVLDELRIFDRALSAGEIGEQSGLYDAHCRGPYVTAAPLDFVPDETHVGDLVIEGTETFVIENKKFLQRGNIYVNDHATLVVKNAQLAMARGDVPTVHVYVFVAPQASLRIVNANIYPANEGTETGLVCVLNGGSTRIVDSQTSIHYFDNYEGARLTMERSSMVFTIGGLVQVSGGDVRLTDSTVAALAMRVPRDAEMNVSGLRSGVYLHDWDVHEIISQTPDNIVLRRSCVLEDDFSGDLEHGPYERGWLFFLDPDAHVRIADSELRKVFLDLVGDTVAFDNLRVGRPSTLAYRDILLDDVTVMGQWPFYLIDAELTISDSDYLFLQPTGDSRVTLRDAHMVEFIPRNFFGTVEYDNALWTEAGEIIGGVPYHSMFNDFTMKGSLRIEGLRENLQWKEATVTREYEVRVVDGDGQPLAGVPVTVCGTTATTDEGGSAVFALVFDEQSYQTPRVIEVQLSGQRLSRPIDFFSTTPVIFTAP